MADHHAIRLFINQNKTTYMMSRNQRTTFLKYEMKSNNFVCSSNQLQKESFFYKCYGFSWGKCYMYSLLHIECAVILCYIQNVLLFSVTDGVWCYSLLQIECAVILRFIKNVLLFSVKQNILSNITGKIIFLCSDYLRQDVHLFGIVNCMLDICGLQALNRL